MSSKHHHGKIDPNVIIVTWPMDAILFMILNVSFQFISIHFIFLFSPFLCPSYSRIQRASAQFSCTELYIIKLKLLNFPRGVTVCSDFSQPSLALSLIERDHGFNLVGPLTKLFVHFQRIHRKISLKNFELAAHGVQHIFIMSYST